MRKVTQSSTSLGTGLANIEVHIVREDGAIDLIHITDLTLGVPDDSLLSTAEQVECEGMTEEPGIQVDKSLGISMRGSYESWTTERIQEPTPAEEPVTEAAPSFDDEDDIL